MKARRSFCAVLAILTIVVAAPGAAAPETRPCAAGATYDPACDVDHDGDVDIFDIQKAAGHWNQSGSWTSDNDHDHLGQTWIGASNPLVINGTFGLPTLAPLALSNSLGYGLSIPSAGLSGVAIGTTGSDGVYVNSVGSPSAVNANPGANGFEIGGAGGHGVYVGRADNAGVFVNSAGGKGVAVGTAGSPSTIVISTANNGFEVLGAENNGLFIGRADGTGVSVNSAGGTGVHVNSASQAGFAVEAAQGDGVRVHYAGGTGVDVDEAVHDGVFVREAGNPSTWTSNSDSNGFEVAGAETHGLFVGRADHTGVLVQSAGDTGLEIRAAGELGMNVTGGVYGAAWFDGDIGVANGSCYGCRLATFAVNVGNRSLAPGDVVTLAGTRATDIGNAPLLLEVVPAAAGQPLVGVVVGRAKMITDDDPRPAETGQRLVSIDGAAAPGDHVSVLYGGQVQARVAAGATIVPGALLTVDRDGRARAMSTVAVRLAQGEGVVDLREQAPVLGMALQAQGPDGLVWVLVNLQ